MATINEELTNEAVETVTVEALDAAKEGLTGSGFAVAAFAGIGVGATIYGTYKLVKWGIEKAKKVKAAKTVEDLPEDFENLKDADQSDENQE